MKTTTKLAISSLKAGKSRSILTATAIFLTTALITVILFGSSALVRHQKTNAAESYGEQFGMFSRLVPEQIEKINLHAQFFNIGSEIYAAEGICKGYTLNLYEMDSVLQMLAHFNIESGSYPKAENEILAQKEFFQIQGCKNPKLGDAVTLSIRANGTGEILEKEFVISGFTPSSEANNLAKRYGAYVSRAFIDKYIPDETERTVYLGFQVKNEENLNFSGMKNKILELAKELGLVYWHNEILINHFL